MSQKNNMSGSVLRGVLIGAGFFAGFQAEAWRRIEGAEIIAVADTQPERAAEFAHRWGIPRAYADAAAMLEVERPDFVDIATRPDSHRALTALAAQHGAQVICQKPMAPSWEECVAMADGCDAAGVRLLIHENWRWQPWYREIKRLLDAGTLGEPYHVGFTMRTGDGRGTEPYSVQPYFREMERLLLYETAVHFVDTFRFLLGDIASVFCQTGRINPRIRGEDYALVQIAFAHGGAYGLIDANRISGPFPPEVAFGHLRLEGDRGMVRLTPDGRLWLTAYGGEETEHRFSTTDQGYKGDSVYAIQRHFVHCLRTGEISECEGRVYLKTVAAVFACYRSADTGQPVAL